MSGHSKWSTIKRKKGALDAKRGKIFSRIVKEIDVSVREGGPDPEANPRLRLAIANAKGVNMPKDNIERAINKADRDPSNLQELTFEGYAPNGVAVFIECLTDNHLRTVGSIRAIFNKRGGNLGTNGSLGFLFDRKGIITVPEEKIHDAEMFELEVIDAGAEDIEVNEEVYYITTSMEDFGKVRKKVEEMGIEPENAGLQRIPNDLKQLDVNDAVKVLKIIEEFEDDDDVQSVYHNLDVTDEVAGALESES
ncbi:MAG: YebC/PmpR family DNA-binding transcriptional regulator [Marinilabiliales bacterium]|nr:MAG: YebC/PmpR family DNA-binding transcriptional regulator [Marinilabiliales bacterium]